MKIDWKKVVDIGGPIALAVLSFAVSKRGEAKQKEDMKAMIIEEMAKEASKSDK